MIYALVAEGRSPSGRAALDEVLAEYGVTEEERREQMRATWGRAPTVQAATAAMMDAVSEDD